MFSGKVESVKNTRIFARLHSDGRQSLIYAMALNAPQDVAMVLPIPVKAGSGEKAVSFVSFKDYPQVFDDLSKGFPDFNYSRSAAGPFGSVSKQKLEVVKVGSFDASYVPSIADFDRLDERFRLSADVWQKLPGYRDHGFAVFKLRAGESEVHPMAFTFPSALANQVFFPTVHVHDGEVHRLEKFDHTLYCQGFGVDHRTWTESPRLAVAFVKAGLTGGIIKADQHVYRRIMRGKFRNEDVIAAALRTA